MAARSALVRVLPLFAGAWMMATGPIPVLAQQDTTSSVAESNPANPGVSNETSPAALWGTAPPETEIGTLVTRDPWVRLPEAVRTMDPRYIPLWIQALQTNDRDLRRQAALAIAIAHGESYIDFSEAAPALLTLIEDSEASGTLKTDVARTLIVLDARHGAAALIGQLGRWMSFDRVVEPALARWQIPEMRPVWLARVQQAADEGARSLPRYRLQLAIQGLAHVPTEDASKPLLNLVLEGDDRGLRIDAARTLGTIQSASLEAHSQTLLDRGGDIDRLAAVLLLATHDSPSAGRLLERMAQDDNAAVAAQAWRRLQQVDNARLVPLVPQTIVRDDSALRRLAIATVLQAADLNSVDVLVTAMGDAHPDVRIDARKTLIELAARPEFSAPVRAGSVRMLGHETWMGREQAAIVIGILDHEPAADALFQLLNDPREEVASAAAWALRRLAIDDMLPALLTYAEDIYQRLPDVPPTTDAVLVHVFDALGEARYRPAEPLLRRWYPKAEPHYPLQKARGSAIWALGMLLEDDEDPAVSRVLVTIIEDEAFIMPEYDEARYAAAVTLSRMRAKSVLPKMREIADGPPLPEIRLTAGWGITRITGEPLLTIPPPIERRSNWFLQPAE